MLETNFLKNNLRRPRRLRSEANLRESIAECSLKKEHFVCPLFVQDSTSSIVEIAAMPGQYRWPVEKLAQHIEALLEKGVKQVAIFPVVSPDKKSVMAEEALRSENLACRSIREIKKKFPEIIIYADVALDPYTLSGHDGIFKEEKIWNDETVEVLIQQSLVLAEAGAHFVSPSDMMDGRVGAIRSSLDKNSFINTGILSYTAKYASSFYGPFRSALGSGLGVGDKKTYQMDYRNSSEALVEAELDFNEGADILMVKPAMAYLDIIHRLKSNYSIPIAAYQVSGEYSMIKFAGINGAIDENKAILESLYCIKRAGADLIFTYFAEKACDLLE